jgi:hypothetical protein
MKEILKRLKSGVPAFWGKVQKICGACAVTASAIYGYGYYDKLPSLASETAKILACMGLFGVFLSQLTVQDNKDFVEQNCNGCNEKEQ